MKLWKTALVGTALLSTAILVSACGGSKSGASSAEKDGKQFTFLTTDNSENHPKHKDFWMWKQYQKKTGVKIKWEETKDLDDKKNLILSRKHLPDAFYQVSWTPDEVVKYGNQGLFIPLEKRMKKDMPHFEALMKKYPQIRANITAPDGHIYTLPEVTPDPKSAGMSFRLYINQKWLDKLHIKKPTTTTELTAALEKFVKDDPNGNGKHDEQGFYMGSGQIANGLEMVLDSAFGMGEGGRLAIADNFYFDQNGKVQLTLNSDKMRDVWKYENGWWKKGLINNSAFSGVDDDKWRADAAKNVVGLWSWVSPEYAGPSIQNDYKSINVLSSPENKQKQLVVSGPSDQKEVVITKDAPNPDAILKWIDWWYSKAGSKFTVLGKKGVTYHTVNGKNVYVDKILKNPKGVQVGSYQYLDSGIPCVHPNANVVFEAQGVKPTKYDDFKKSYMPKKNYTEVMPTAEESQELSTILTDLNNYVTQSRAKFITGKWNFTTDWTKYKAQLKKLGADKLLKIRRAQVKRGEKFIKEN